MYAIGNAGGRMMYSCNLHGKCTLNKGTHNKDISKVYWGCIVAAACSVYEMVYCGYIVAAACMLLAMQEVE
jgi:hypothetical protein